MTTLLPHQRRLSETFFDRNCPRIVLLKSDPGLGKITALASLIADIYKARPETRVLILVPAPLRSLFGERLLREGVPVVLVDRFQYRTMLTLGTDGELWAPGKVFVLSREFARQEDVAPVLAAISWDLLVVDEAHTFGGAQISRTLKGVSLSSKRVLLMTGRTSVQELVLSLAPRPADLALVEWKRDEVVDGQGRKLDSIPRPRIDNVNFNLSDAELALERAVSTVYEEMAARSGQDQLIARSLVSSLQSSPSALESALVRFRTGRSLPFDSEEMARASEDLSVEPAGKSTEILERLTDAAIDQLDTVQSDSKLVAFGQLLERLGKPSDAMTRVCVVTRYVSTAFYLAAEIDRLGLTCRIFTGELASKSREELLEQFRRDGGVLVATRASLGEEISLMFTTDLIYYDGPNIEVLERLLPLFDGFGRKTQLNVHLLLAANGIFGDALRLVTERVKIILG